MHRTSFDRKEVLFDERARINFFWEARGVTRKVTISAQKIAIHYFGHKKKAAPIARDGFKSSIFIEHPTVSFR